MLYAVEKTTSFNVIHLASGFKLDLFVKGGGKLDLPASGS